MNKTELVENIAKTSGVSFDSASNFLKAFTDIIQTAMVEGEKVQITGFGSFEPTVRAAHKGRNPKTGEEIMIAESHSAKFYPGSTLRDALNQK